MKSCTRSLVFDGKAVRTNEVSSDEEMIMHSPNSKIITELSDDDLMECVKHVYINE
jgi:hypothetical protein